VCVVTVSVIISVTVLGFVCVTVTVSVIVIGFASIVTSRVSMIGHLQNSGQSVVVAVTVFVVVYFATMVADDTRLDRRTVERRRRINLRDCIIRSCS